MTTVYHVSFLVRKETSENMRFYVRIDVEEGGKEIYEKSPMESPYFRNLLKHRIERKLQQREIKLYDVRVQDDFYDDLEVYDSMWICKIKGGCPEKDIQWYLISLERKSG